MMTIALPIMLLKVIVSRNTKLDNAKAITSVKPLHMKAVVSGILRKLICHNRA